MTRRTEPPAIPKEPAPPPAETPSPDGSGEGMLDLDDHDQINNQHLEVR
jgi:hypothetical protein